MTETTDQVVERLLDRIWPHCHGDCKAQLKRSKGKGCCCGNLENRKDTEVLLREALRIGREQAARNLGNLIDHWDGMANDTKDELRELETGFCSAMDAIRNLSTETSV